MVKQHTTLSQLCTIVQLSHSYTKLLNSLTVMHKAMLHEMHTIVYACTKLHNSLSHAKRNIRKHTSVAHKYACTINSCKKYIPTCKKK